MHVAAHRQRPSLHPQERLFLIIALVQLIFLPWAFGTMHVWSQLTALCLAVLLLGVALWPRFYSAKLTDGNEFRLVSWPRLVRFPLFWLGAGLLVLLLVQALNPGFQFQRNETTWWLVRLRPVTWLPTSVATPFERFNLWRAFIIYATVWLTVCALWIGITRRRTVQILVGLLVGNAVILGLLGFVHKASGVSKVLWLQDFPGSASFSSFVYQNHAGAYFSLMSFVALGLSVWHFFEGRKRMAKSTPSALWMIAALLLVFAVVFSLSRGAIVSLAVFGLAAMIAVVLLRFTTATQSTTSAAVPWLVALMILGTVGFLVREMDFSAVQYRFEQLSKLQANDPSVLSRKLARESAAAMLGDHWARGVGAGGFRYLFPIYIKDKPLIYENGRFFWNHAHNDWLEIPIDLGLTGVLLIAGALGWIGWAWSRSGGWRNPLTLMIALGCGQVMAHAVMDFPFQNPAILVTWWSLLVISLRWLELDTSGGPQHRPRSI